MKKVQGQPFYVLLLPVFFAIHGYQENLGLVPLLNVLVLVGWYILVTILLAGLLYLFSRSLLKSALLTGFVMSLYFFFGAIQDFLKLNVSLAIVSRYRFLLPFLFLLMVICYRVIVRNSTRLFGLTRFLNVLLLVSILADVVQIMIKSTSRRASAFSVSDHDSATVNNNKPRPDIYFLLFDEYEGSSTLKERYGFQNDLDSFLLRRGFFLPENSKSNYNFTPFSVASILNMGYLKGTPQSGFVAAEDYARCNLLIADSKVESFLKSFGYRTLNYSIFDITGNPAPVGETFLPVRTKLITSRTLLYRMNKDIGWLLWQYFPSVRADDQTLKNNNIILKLLYDASTSRPGFPRFIYAHLVMPHHPYYFDQTGRRINDNHRESWRSYLNYVQYTNGVIKKLVDHISRSDPKAIIVVMGDHGYRFDLPEGVLSQHIFSNFNAVRAPGKNTGSLYDGISGVNQFRMIFNDVFDQRFARLKDSTFFLQDSTSSGNFADKKANDNQ